MVELSCLLIDSTHLVKLVPIVEKLKKLVCPNEFMCVKNVITRHDRDLNASKNLEKYARLAKPCLDVKG